MVRADCGRTADKPDGVTNPGLYGALAPWFHLLTPPSEYADEAAWCGNTSSHLRRDLRLTLTDLSTEMLDLSRIINPDIEHVVGDMRRLRLDRVGQQAEPGCDGLSGRGRLGPRRTNVFAARRPKSLSGAASAAPAE